jgi:enoyl-CoA hydratase/carnithine racemase
VTGKFRSVRLERDGPVATVAIDRPQARNSITREVGLEIFDAVSRVAADTSVSVLVFRGVGNDFCCGADSSAGADRGEPCARSVLFAPQSFGTGGARDRPGHAPVASESFEDELAGLVERLSGFAPQALASLKSNYVEAGRLDLSSFVLLEAERHNRLLQTDDCREAFSARAQKRPPKFTGR